MVSITVSSTPAAIAGRASGRLTLKNAPQTELPKARAARKVVPDCCRKDARASR